MSEMTTEILEQNLGKVVLVRLKGGKSLRGRLKGFDQHLNLVHRRNRRHNSHRKSKETGTHNRPRRQRSPNLASAQVTKHGKRHTVNGQAPRQSRSHKMPTLRKTSIPRTRQTMRSLRIRRNNQNQTLQLATQNPAKSKSRLKTKSSF